MSLETAKVEQQASESPHSRMFSTRHGEMQGDAWRVSAPGRCTSHVRRHVVVHQRVPSRKSPKSTKKEEQRCEKVWAGGVARKRRRHKKKWSDKRADSSTATPQHRPNPGGEGGRVPAAHQRSPLNEHARCTAHPHHYAALGATTSVMQAETRQWRCSAPSPSRCARAACPPP